MANDDTSDVGDTGKHVDTVAQEKGVARAATDVSGRATLAVSLTDLMRLLDGERELAPILPTAAPEVRLARLERRSTEMEWVVYGLLGVFLMLFLLRR